MKYLQSFNLEMCQHAYRSYAFEARVLATLSRDAREFGQMNNAANMQALSAVAYTKARIMMERIIRGE